MFTQVVINGKEYPIKFSQSVLGRIMKKNNIKLSEFNESVLQDIVFLYEFIFMAVSYACKREGVVFEHDLESFTYELDDDQGAMERCITAFAESQDTGEEIKKGTAKKKTAR